MAENLFLPEPKDAGRCRETNAAMGLGAALGLVGLAAFVSHDGREEAARCIDCGACNAVGDACPGGIEDEAGLVAATRAGDWTAFVERSGLLCTRCGICSSLCPVGLDLARIFAKAHDVLRGELVHVVPAETVRGALREGRVGGEFIDAAMAGLDER